MLMIGCSFGRVKYSSRCLLCVVRGCGCEEEDGVSLYFVLGVKLFYYAYSFNYWLLGALGALGTLGSFL